ncbi:hypothetical protein D3C72_1675200 [compost metagenome]
MVVGLDRLGALQAGVVLARGHRAVAVAVEGGEELGHGVRLALLGVLGLGDLAVAVAVDAAEDEGLVLDEGGFDDRVELGVRDVVVVGLGLHRSGHAGAGEALGLGPATRQGDGGDGGGDEGGNEADHFYLQLDKP